eukprot:m.825525 g.825525  ORF g.825525 m.825525 type:complete len:184 (+) comp23406_c0_seq54:151-702(+)
MSSPCGFVEWLEFFLGAGIPDSHAKSYAEVFESNRMDFDMLGDLDRDVLSAMGITVMGDVLAIKKHAGQVIAQGGIAKSVSSGGIRSNSAGGSAGAAKSLVRDALDAKASAARAAHRKRKAVKHSSGNKSGIFRLLLDRKVRRALSGTRLLRDELMSDTLMECCHSAQSNQASFSGGFRRWGC